MLYKQERVILQCLCLNLVCWDSIETIVSVTCIHATIHNITGLELVNDGSRTIVIPLVATVLSVGIFLLVLVVVVLIVFMSKQITNA